MMAFNPQLSCPPPTYNPSMFLDDFALPPPPSWDASLDAGGNSLRVEDYLVQGDDETASLPPGFKFRPTDEELVVHYLQLEFLGAAPKGLITHADIYNYHPHQLSDLVAEDHGDGKMYFYTRIKKIGQSKTDRRVKPNKGFWKPTQSPTSIRGYTGTIIGYKTPLVFFQDKKKTQWLMQEYRLHHSHTSHRSSQQELVLAVVYYLPRKGRDNDNDNDDY